MRRTLSGHRASTTLAAVILSAFASPAIASTWSDLPFPDLVQRSELIVVGEVTDPGDLNRCTVRVVDTLKGSTSTKQIGVGGYNDRQGRSRSLRKGERFLLFLRKPGDALQEFGSLSGDGAEVYLQQPASAFYVLPTPSSGDYPIDDRGVRGNPFNPTWPEDHGPSSLPLVLDVVRSLAGPDKRATALLDSQLRGLPARLRTIDVRNDVEKGNAVWLLFAAARVASDVRVGDDAGQLAAKLDDPLLAAAGIELLAARGTPASRPMLIDIVKDAQASGVIRGLAANAAAKLGATDDELGPAIAAALATASAEIEWNGPLKFIRMSSADLLLDAAIKANALDQLKDVLIARAADVVTADNPTAERIAQALLRLRSSDARKRVIAAFEKAELDRHRYVAARFLLLDGAPVSIEAVLKKLRAKNRDVYDVRPALDDFAFLFPNHPELPAVLERHLSADDREILFGAAFIAGDARTRTLIEGYRGRNERPLAELVLRALDAKEKKDPRGRVNALLDILDGQTGMEFLIRNAVLFEVVRSTPKGDEAAVVARIRKSNAHSGLWGVGENLSFHALVALGAVLTAEEEEQRRRSELKLAGPFATRP